MEPPIDVQDWELINEFDQNPKLPDPFDNSDYGAIKPDYFSLNPRPKPPQSEDDIDEGGVDSDNPSWVDPDSDSRYLERSRGRLSFSGVKDSRSFWSDESSDEPRSVVEESEEAMGEKEEEEQQAKDKILERDSGGDGERAWWRTPLEILKVWVVRARPVWSISIAAAIIGVLMLGRRLYKMKQRSKSIPLKLVIDDKKASLFKARVARLNEAFSVVKRVPTVRPSLPAGGVTPWPVASLR